MDLNRPAVTFIMPVYNAEQYISAAIESILLQNVNDWELLIINDGSTDKTLSIAQEYALKDSRIKILEMPFGSGSAYQPRKHGIMNASAEIVAPLDADDFIGENYLEQLLELKTLTGASAVYPSMYSFSDTRIALLVPKDTSLLDKAFTGKNCVGLTLNGWEVGCNGGLIDKKLYLDAFEKFDSSISHTFADELLARQLLFLAPSVAFSSAKYYYRQNLESITHTPSLKQFDSIFKNISLIEFIRENYSEDSIENIKVHCQNLYGIMEALEKLNNYKYSKETEKEVYKRLEKAKQLIDYKLLKGKTSPRYLALSKLPFSTIRKILKTGLQTKKLLKKFLQGQIDLYKDFQKFFDKTHQIYLLSKGEYPSNHSYKRFLELNYPNGTPCDEKVKEGFICLCDGKFVHGGITDRLRGILTVYDILKRRNVPFYISWTHPFPLEDYLVPAGHDWRIDKNDVIYNGNISFPYINDDETVFWSEKRLKYGLKQFKPQVHIYSNADNSRGRYRELYHELFQPSDALKDALKPHIEILGDNYEAYSFRFLQLLGDFQDWGGTVLSSPDAKKLMESCLGELMRMVNYSRAEKILITSDSKRYLDFVKERDPRFYIVPGEIKHSDLTKGNYPEIWMKTFIDQHLLMSARKVTLMRTGMMYKSGFPRFAAEVGGAQFIDHPF